MEQLGFVAAKNYEFWVLMSRMTPKTHKQSILICLIDIDCIINDAGFTN